tara:strand:+ start:5601 stop:6101 length:501 start_codon:yes stop_codon:yes gene_type:complete
MVDKEVIRPNEYRIYKPYGEDKGGASAFQMKITNTPSEKIKRKVELFWVSANQTGVDENKNARFGWQEPTGSATMKIGMIDIGEILLALRGKKEEITLYHQNKSGNTIVKITRGSTKSGPVLNFQMSSKRGNAEAVRVRHNITQGEAQILDHLLSDFVSEFYRWSL